MKDFHLNLSVIAASIIHYFNIVLITSTHTVQKLRKKY